MEREKSKEELIAINRELLKSGHSLVRQDSSSKTVVNMMGMYLNVVCSRKKPIIGSRGIEVGEEWVNNGGADFVDSDLIDLSKYQLLEVENPPDIT